jgi:hypothetical protein
MKFKNKIFTLLGVFTLVGLSHSFTLKDLNAALTAPSSYDFNYQYSSSLNRFVIGRSSLGTIAPSYTLTADGGYVDYSATLTSSSNSGGILPEGLDITMIFNRSNTSWQGLGPFPFQSWFPNDTKIGSDQFVGTVTAKYQFIFNNQTNQDYLLYFDISTSTGTTNVQYKVNDLTQASSLILGSIQNNFIISSFSKIEIYTNSTSGARFFDAWYLQDLGVDLAYELGYDIGQAIGYQDGLGNNPNILLNGFQAMVGILVNFVLMIVNLEVFDVSIMSIFAIVVLFTGIVWVLKLIRG